MINILTGFLVHHESLFRRSLLLSSLLILALTFGISTNAVLDPDMGWHLRTGHWILSEGRLPQTDPFSASGQGKPWIAYSWLFEIILAVFHDAMGLTGIVAFTALMGIAIAVALLSLLGEINPNPGIAIALAGLGVFTMAPILQTPRPWLFSILLFILELKILLSVGRNRNIRTLALLIPIFWFWANLQIQFIYGLLLLIVFLLEPWASRYLHRHGLSKQNPPIWNRHAATLIVLCFVATIAGPYHYKLYAAISDVVLQTGVYQTISEMQAIPFRTIQDWLFLLTTLWAAYWLGKRQGVSPFLTLVYLGGVFVSFRSQRDTFFLIVPALAIVATSLPRPGRQGRALFTRSQSMLAGAMLALSAIVLAVARDINTAGLDKAVAESYPSAAVYVVKLRNLPGPLYNDYNLGGFLLWQLPDYRISIDGRANFYGDERISRHSNTLFGRYDWRDDAELARARLVILGRNYPLSSILKLDTRFELYFEDNISSVFVANDVP